MIEYYKSLVQVFEQWRFWFYYSIQDVKNKYTRSFIGPFWITISMLVMVFAMGPLYSVIFSMNSAGNYFLYLATGIVYWSFISNVIIESCDVYINNATFIRQSDFALTIYVARLLSRNTIIFLHNITIPIGLTLYYQPVLDFWWCLYMPIWILVTIAFLFPLSLSLSIVCTRFRDMGPLVQNAVQLGMFLTPVFWVLGDGKHDSIYVRFNPFFYLLDGFRYSFQIANSASHLSIVITIAAILFPISCIFYVKSYKKVVYWI